MSRPKGSKNKSTIAKIAEKTAIDAPQLLIPKMVEINLAPQSSYLVEVEFLNGRHLRISEKLFCNQSETYLNPDICSGYKKIHKNGTESEFISNGEQSLSQPDKRNNRGSKA